MRQFHLLAAIMAISAVSACETVQGAGRDMQTASRMVSQYYNTQGYNPNTAQQVQTGQAMVQDPFATQPPRTYAAESDMTAIR